MDKLKLKCLNLRKILEDQLNNKQLSKLSTNLVHCLTFQNINKRNSRKTILSSMVWMKDKLRKLISTSYIKQAKKAEV